MPSRVPRCEKTFCDFLGWCESQRSRGIVDQCCSEMRPDESIQNTGDGRPRIVLPGPNRPDSTFAAECGQILGPKNVWFRKGDLVVEVRQKVLSENVTHLGFHPLRPVEVCTAIEQYIEIGNLFGVMAGWRFLFLFPSPKGERTFSLIRRSSSAHYR